MTHPFFVALKEGAESSEERAEAEKQDRKRSACHHTWRYSWQDAQGAQDWLSCASCKKTKRVTWEEQRASEEALNMVAMSMLRNTERG